ncbi:MAG: ribosome maturation factor RimP [Gemmatimonadota bacterium]|nr:ribosome maturation factor RimP [Gemmatimonadota bacterium]
MNPELQTIVEQEVARLGYELVDLRLGGSRGRPVLDVRIDVLDGGKVKVGDCEVVSRALSERLDASPDVVAGRYVLEVSSPGLERPLRAARDWRRFVGRRATVKSARFAAVGGHVEVEIVAVAGDGVDARVTVRDAKATEYELALAEIEQARLAVHWNN